MPSSRIHTMSWIMATCLGLSANLFLGLSLGVFLHQPAIAEDTGEIAPTPPAVPTIQSLTGETNLKENVIPNIMPDTFSSTSPVDQTNQNKTNVLEQAPQSPEGTISKEPISKESIRQENIWKNTLDKGAHQKQVGDYKHAEKTLREALTLANKFGANDLRLAKTLNELAGVYRQTNQYKEAEDLYKQALPIIIANFGGDDANTATIKDNLALVLDGEKRWEEGEDLHKQALSIFKKTLGPDSLDYAMNLSNLGMAYTKRDKFSDAEDCFKQAIAIEEKLPDNKVQLATALDNLASVYYNQEKYEKCGEIRKKALELYKQALGEEHPETAICMRNLGTLDMVQGNCAEAVILLKRSLAILKKSLRSDHPLIHGVHGVERDLALAEQCLKDKHNSSNNQ